MRRRVSLLFLAVLVGACGGQPIGGRAEGSARIALGAPADLDPARTGDAESSAVIAQLFETLTTFDASLELRPALAESWRVEDDGRQVVFTPAADLTFSDGTPLRASDVVRSWFRVIDPADPSPLVTLVRRRPGRAGLRGRGRRARATSACARTTVTRTVTVDFERAAADFPAIVASPTFAVVPAIDRRRRCAKRERAASSAAGDTAWSRRAPRRWCSRRTRGTGPGRRRSGPSRS